MDGRLVAGTKEVYSRKKLIAYFSTNFPNHLDDNGELVMPLDSDAVLAFMGVHCRHADQRLKSSSTIGGYKSMIKDLYTQREMVQSPELVSRLKQFGGGFKRTVNTARQNSEVPLQEGKSPLPIQGYRLLAKLALNPNH